MDDCETRVRVKPKVHTSTRAANLFSPIKSLHPKKSLSKKDATKRLTLTSMHWHFRMLQGSCCNILRQAPYHHQPSKGP